MRIHSLQHVPFENLANIQSWAENKKHEVSSTKLYQNDAFPSIENINLLIILGGPMNIYEEEKYSWLRNEKKFIENALAENKFVLGICLGAQLLADVLGGKVRKNEFTEIGWHTVKKTPEAGESVFLNSFPSTFTAFHWHGDTFDIPPGALRLADSEACRNQAFEYNGRALGLQFHIESSEQSIANLILSCQNDLTDGKFIQHSSEMIYKPALLHEIYGYLNAVLDAIENRVNNNL